jgi:5-bromo-4-chloroindolyl phosphate hydrolysis protein
MIDFNTTRLVQARVLGHRQNIERYCRLLATELTDLERQYLHKRIAEEHAQLERLEKSKEEQQSEVRLIKGGTGERCDMMGAGE